MISSDAHWGSNRGDPEHYKTHRAPLCTESRRPGPKAGAPEERDELSRDVWDMKAGHTAESYGK